LFRDETEMAEFLQWEFSQRLGVDFMPTITETTEMLDKYPAQILLQAMKDVRVFFGNAMKTVYEDELIHFVLQRAEDIQKRLDDDSYRAFRPIAQRPAGYTECSR
jgi:hypothetical protein